MKNKKRSTFSALLSPRACIAWPHQHKSPLLCKIPSRGHAKALGFSVSVSDPVPRLLSSTHLPALQQCSIIPSCKPFPTPYTNGAIVCEMILPICASSCKDLPILPHVQRDQDPQTPQSRPLSSCSPDAQNFLFIFSLLRASNTIRVASLPPPLSCPSMVPPSTSVDLEIPTERPSQQAFRASPSKGKRRFQIRETERACTVQEQVRIPCILRTCCACFGMGDSHPTPHLSSRENSLCDMFVLPYIGEKE